MWHFSVSSCNHHFTWSSPYACKASDSQYVFVWYKSCWVQTFNALSLSLTSVWQLINHVPIQYLGRRILISIRRNYQEGMSRFYLLRREENPQKRIYIYIYSCLYCFLFWFSYVTTDERGVTYHVNLCDAADTCDDGISVCFEERRTKTSVASFKNQMIMADGMSLSTICTHNYTVTWCICCVIWNFSLITGYQLLFHMSMLGEGKSHAIVRVVCLTADNPDDHQPNTVSCVSWLVSLVTWLLALVTWLMVVSIKFLLCPFFVQYYDYIYIYV